MSVIRLCSGVLLGDDHLWNGRQRSCGGRNPCARCSHPSTADFKSIINHMEMNGTDLVLRDSSDDCSCFICLALFPAIAHANPVRNGAALR